MAFRVLVTDKLAEEGHLVGARHRVALALLDARDQAAAADRDEDRMDRARMLAQDFHRDGALARDDVGIVERVNEREVLCGFEQSRVLARLVEVGSLEYGFAAKVFRVTDWQFGLRSPVGLTLQEDGPDIYDEADAATADPDGNGRRLPAQGRLKEVVAEEGLEPPTRGL